MDKVIFFLLGFVMLTACSTTDSPIENGESTHQSYESVEALKAYNDAIISNSYSRGFGHWCAVGTADVLGAYKLARIGFSIGSIFGPNGAAAGLVIGGVVGGVGGSYGANSVMNSSAPHSSRDVFLNSLQIYSELNQTTRPIADWGINCPDDMKNEVLLFGQYHNEILSQIIDNFVENPDEDIIMKKYEASVFDFLRDEEYLQAYAELYKESVELSHTQNVGFDDESGQIMKLFIDAVSKSPNNEESVKTVIRDYIDIIESKSSLAFDERKILYCSFSTAEASCKYWLTVYSE